MPELVLYSRRWHATTDTLPFPLSFGALFHAVFLIVYGALIGRFGVWSSCPGQGANYIAVTGGLMAIIFAELVLELAMIYCGLKGAQTATCLGRQPLPAPLTSVRKPSLISRIPATHISAAAVDQAVTGDRCTAADQQAQASGPHDVCFDHLLAHTDGADGYARQPHKAMWLHRFAPAPGIQQHT